MFCCASVRTPLGYIGLRSSSLNFERRCGIRFSSKYLVRTGNKFVRKTSPLTRSPENNRLGNFRNAVFTRDHPSSMGASFREETPSRFVLGESTFRSWRCFVSRDRSRWSGAPLVAGKTTRMMKKEGSAFSLGRSSLSRSREEGRGEGRGGGAKGYASYCERGRKGVEKWARQGGKKSGGNERTRWVPPSRVHRRSLFLIRPTVTDK